MDNQLVWLGDQLAYWIVAILGCCAVILGCDWLESIRDRQRELDKSDRQDQLYADSADAERDTGARREP